MGQAIERITEKSITTVSVRNANVSTLGKTVYLYLTPEGGGLADRVEMGTGTGRLAFIGAATARKVIRANSAPGTRVDGTALVAGDGWVDTSNRDKQYIYASSAWEIAQVDIPCNWALVTPGRYVCDVIADPGVSDITLKSGVVVIIRDVTAL